MKNILCALLLSTATLISVQPLQAVDDDKVPVLWARDNSVPGILKVITSDKAVPFSSESRNRSGGNISRPNDSLFLIEPGVYEITFVGSFRFTGTNPNDTENVEYQVAFRINGVQQHWQTQDSLSMNIVSSTSTPPYSPVASTTLSGAFDFESEKTLEVIVKKLNNTTGTVTLESRSIIIEKLQ